jgi:hypothetical protein
VSGGAADAPLVAGPLYGLRAWSVRRTAGGDRLAGPFAATEWPADGLSATCTYAGHAAPGGDCSCGVYGWHPTEHSAATVLDGGRDSVGGIVAVWGAVEVHRAGFRAAHGRPHVLVLPPGAGAKHERRLRRLAEAYGAQVLKGGADELLEHCAAHGLGLDAQAVAALVDPAERRRRRREAAGAAARLAATVLGVVALLVGAVQAWPAVAAWWRGEPTGSSARAAVPAEVRSLRITSEYVVEADDGSSAYLAVVRNDHPTKAALGVFAEGTLRGRDGQTLARLDDRLAFDFRAMIAPGDSAVVVDELEGVEPIKGRVRTYRTRPLARRFRPGVSPIRIGGVRLVRSRCIVAATVTSDRARVAAGVAVLARRARGRLAWAQLVDVGPLPEGRSRQVVMRVPPRQCRRHVTTVGVYPDLVRRQVVAPD